MNRGRYQRRHGNGDDTVTSIARLAARKSLDEVFLEPAPGKGMRSLVKLPAVVDKS